MAIGQEVTIAGIGFAQGDKIVVGDKTIDATIAADGVKFSVPADLADGEYAVSLVRGNSTWELGKVYAYQQRQVESITITDNAFLTMYAPMLGLEEGKLILNFAYNEDGSLKAISSNGAVEWAFEYSGKTITTKICMISQSHILLMIRVASSAAQVTICMVMQLLIPGITMQTVIL